MAIKFGTSGWRAVIAEEFTFANVQHAITGIARCVRLFICGHVPEKDGIIAGLLAARMVARRRKAPREQLQFLFSKVGSFYPLRENFRLTTEVKEKFTNKLWSEVCELGGRKISEVVRTDGLKLVFKDGSWICYRISGSGPVVRVYTEARSRDDLAKLIGQAKDWIFH